MHCACTHPMRAHALWTVHAAHCRASDGQGRAGRTSQAEFCHSDPCSWADSCSCSRAQHAHTC